VLELVLIAHAACTTTEIASQIYTMDKIKPIIGVKSAFHGITQCLISNLHLNHQARGEKLVIFVGVSLNEII
jgi:hypothetical protein